MKKTVERLVLLFSFLATLFLLYAIFTSAPLLIR
jgi:hypothetical protein